MQHEVAPANIEFSDVQHFRFARSLQPACDVKQHGHPRLRMRHAPFPIGTRQRDQWLGCMAQAMDTCEIEGDVRAFLDARFAHVADFMRNTEG